MYVRGSSEKSIGRDIAILTLLLSLALFANACGPGAGEAILDSDCKSEPGGACIARADGGALRWNLSKLTPGEEYMLVVQSRANTNRLDEYSHSIRLSTDRPSRSLSSSETERTMNLRSRSQLGPVSPSGRDQHIFSPVPGFQGQRNVGDIESFYVPAPADYFTVGTKNSSPFIAHSPEGDSFTGRDTNIQTFSVMPNFFELKFDQTTFQANSLTQLQQNATNYSFLQQLDTCLRQVMPAAFDYLGAPPYRVNANNPLKVVVTELSGVAGSATAGLFSERDLFVTEGGRTIADSNKGEVIAISRRSGAFVEEACATGPHEFQHLISFLYKVIAKLPADQRTNLDARKDSGARSEDLSINESNSHIFEEFSGVRQQVAYYIRNFILDPNGTPLALEAAAKDAILDYKARGLTTLIQYFAIKKAGGTLNPLDPVTKNYLVSRIKSPNIGFQNIADYFGMTEDEFMREFYMNFVQVLRGIKDASQFIPAPEVSASGVSRGIRILDAATNPRDFDLNEINIVHPLQVNIPLIDTTIGAAVQAKSVNFYRYIVPSANADKGSLNIQTDGAPFTAFVIPIR